jgi:NADH-quinone oxidoreductase subunit L
LWGVGLLTAVLTAVYMTRMMVMTFWGDERFHQALPDGDHPHDAAHAEENAFAAGDAHDDAMHHGHAHGEHDTHQIGHTDDQDEDEEHHALAPDFRPHESPWTMTVPLIVLAVLSTLGGLVGVPYALSGGVIPNEFEHVLEPVIAKVSHKETKHAPTGLGEHGAAGKPATANESGHSTSPMTQTDTAEHTTEAAHAEHSPEEIRTERILAGFSVLLAALGIGIGWMIFKKEPLKIMPRILQEKWRIDELYNGYIVNPITDISRNGLWRGFDVGVIDGIVNGIGHFVTALGGVARGVQVGFVRSYAAFILFGALVVIGYFIYYGFKLVG